ncbi:hypothetical protein P7C70_g3232, partial [Phenoliferia sp. Uapishka_3]
MVVNTQVIYNEVPVGIPIPGKTLKLVKSELDIETVPLNGGVLVKTLALSLDPYMRGRMRDPSQQSYSATYELGKPIDGVSAAKVIRSESAAHPVGTFLYGRGRYEEYSVLSPEELKYFRVLENSGGLPWTTIVGGAGMSGQTAWWSFYEIGKPKKGETIFVSAAAGAVGQVVCQLAKKEGLKVIGSAGSDDKVEFLKTIGVDIAFNYKKESTLKVLQENNPDIYFDNVGGETLDNVLETMTTFGRIIACGAVSQYNLKPEERYALKNYILIVGKQITYQGFIITGKNLDGFFEAVPKLIKSGELKIKEHVTYGLDDGQAFVDMLSGAAQGKAVISLE